MSDQLQLLPASELFTQIERLTPKQQETLREYLNRRATEEALSTLAQENEQLRKRVALQEERTEQAVIQSEERDRQLHDQLRQVADAGARRALHADKYYTRSAIGGLFAPNISGPRMTKLLRVVGVLGMQDNILTDHMRGKQPLARRRANTDYPTWEFHCEKLAGVLDKWLIEHDVYESFHATVTKDDRDRFIDMLYEEYVQ